MLITAIQPDDAPSITRFTVDVTNQARVRFDTALDAILHATSMVHLGGIAATKALDALRAGKRVDYAYGFTEATLWPAGNVVPKEGA